MLDTPNKMIDDAKEHSNFPILKVKLDHNNLEECLRGIRKVSKDSALILDANESFNFKTLDSNMDLFLETNVDLIEQPLAAGQDDEGSQTGLRRRPFHSISENGKRGFAGCFG